MPVPNPKTVQTVLPFILADTEDNTIFRNVTQTMLTQDLNTGTYFALAADRLFFNGAYGPEGQLITHNFVYADLSNSLSFTSQSGYNQTADVHHYLNFTPRTFFDVGNFIGFEFGEHVGRVIAADIENLFAFDSSTRRTWLSSNTLTGTQSLVGLFRADTYDDFGFTQVVDSSATEYERSFQQSVIRQSLGYRISNSKTDKTYTPFVGEGADGFPAVSETPPTIGTGTLTLTLASPAMTLVLANPEWGNEDKIEFAQIDRPTRGGDRKVFAELNWVETQSLRLRVQNMKCDPAQLTVDEIIDFLNASLGHAITLDDWEGRSWTGYIIAPETTVVAHNKGIDFEIIFEGTLV